MKTQTLKKLKQLIDEKSKGCPENAYYIQMSRFDWDKISKEIDYILKEETTHE